MPFTQAPLTAQEAVNRAMLSSTAYGYRLPASNASPGIAGGMLNRPHGYMNTIQGTGIPNLNQGFQSLQGTGAAPFYMNMQRYYPGFGQ